jgi:tetratricopeptide (TPR) repeat protein
LAKAFEHYKLALQIDPGHKGAHEYIGEAYLMDQRPAEAERHLAELARLCGNQNCEEYVDLAEAIESFKGKSSR